MFAQLARETGPRTGATFAGADQTGDAQDLDDELLDALVAGLP